MFPLFLGFSRTGLSHFIQTSFRDRVGADPPLFCTRSHANNRGSQWFKKGSNWWDHQPDLLIASLLLGRLTYKRSTA